MPVPTSRALEVAGRHRAFCVFAAMRKKRPAAVFFWGNPRCHWTAARSKQVNAGQRVRCGSSADWLKGRFTGWLKQIDNCGKSEYRDAEKRISIGQVFEETVGPKTRSFKTWFTDQESMQSMPFRVSRCAILEDELRQKSEAFFELSESDFRSSKRFYCEAFAWNFLFFQICTHINTYHIVI